jgi:hypothetical protein
MNIKSLGGRVVISLGISPPQREITTRFFRPVRGEPLTGRKNGFFLGTQRIFFDFDYTQDRRRGTPSRGFTLAGSFAGALVGGAPYPFTLRRRGTPLIRA